MSEEPTSLRDLIISNLAEMDPNLSRTDPGWAPAAFLLASAVLGCEPAEIADVLEMDHVSAGVFAERARRSGIWRDGEVQSAPWMEEEGGGVAFFMDTTVISGDLIRNPDDTYQMSPEGLARVEKMLGRSQHG
jgi:hypothetical protein